VLLNSLCPPPPPPHPPPLPAAPCLDRTTVGHHVLHRDRPRPLGTKRALNSHYAIITILVFRLALASLAARASHAAHAK
jgi:hypothetical protein